MEYEMLLMQALNSRRGIVVTTSNAEQLRAKLYIAKKKDESYTQLAFVLSPTAPTTELLILKKEAA
jgi:hypothetical protein